MSREYRTIIKFNKKQDKKIRRFYENIFELSFSKPTFSMIGEINRYKLIRDLESLNTKEGKRENRYTKSLNAKPRKNF